MGPSTTVLIGTFRKDSGSTIRAFIGCENEKGSKDELLQDDSNCAINTLSSNLGDLLEQIENRCDGNTETWYAERRTARVECLKRELRSSLNVAWHLYDVADLWAALKNYLRHLPSCPLGSVYFTEWSRVQWQYMDNQRNEIIQSLLHRLDKNDYMFVKSVFRSLYRIAYRCSGATPTSPENSVGSLELATRLGPYLLWERGQAPRHSTKEKVSLQTVWLISYMIDNYNDLF